MRCGGEPGRRRCAAHRSASAPARTGPIVDATAGEEASRLAQRETWIRPAGRAPTGARSACRAGSAGAVVGTALACPAAADPPCEHAHVAERLRRTGRFHLVGRGRDDVDALAVAGRRLAVNRKNSSRSGDRPMRSTHETSPSPEAHRDLAALATGTTGPFTGPSPRPAARDRPRNELHGRSERH